MRAHRRESNAQRRGGLSRGKPLGQMKDDPPFGERQAVTQTKLRTEFLRFTA